MLESWKLNVLSFGDEEARSMGIKTKRVRLVDNLARLLATVEIPIIILTSILGVPFFICIFTRNQKGW